MEERRDENEEEMVMRVKGHSEKKEMKRINA